MSEHSGHGSSGSWRDDRLDSTQSISGGTKYGDHSAEELKTGTVRHSQVPLRAEANGNKRPMRFVSLHHHSTFSYLDGYQLPEVHVRRAMELNMGGFALTEHGNIDSHVKLETATAGTGIKPLYGCEVYMPAGDDWTAPERTQRKYHLTLIAANAEGYRSLIRIVTESWINFYYEATVTWDTLLKYKAGIFVLSGCQGSLLFCSTVGGKNIEPEEASYRRGLAVAQRFKEELGSRYFIEVQAFPELEATCQANPMLARIARKVGARLVATKDAHYTALDEQEVQKILHNLRPGEKRSLEEQVRDWGYNSALCPPTSDTAIYRELRRTGLTKKQAVEAIVSTEEIAEDSNVELPKLPMVRFPVPEGYAGVKEYWRDLLREGWQYRGMPARSAEYRERMSTQLKHEMDMVEGKDFVDYFLLVRAGVVFIKDQGIPVGPARGSAAASVAAWLLRITEVNPLEFPYLRFDRFISVDRQDLPDIDIDFPGESRPVLRDFYERMLGEGCVNNVGTFTQFKGKNSLDDAARVFGVPKWEIDTVKNFLIERSSGDLRASSTIEDTVEQFDAAREVFERHPELRKSQLLEGNVKAIGVHAAGLILSNKPITSVTTIMEKEVPSGSGNVIQAIPLDKKDAERQGMVKMDFLGLHTMSVLWEAIRQLGMSIEDLYALPLDDPEVYNYFQHNDVVGVFQFDGRANRYVSGSVLPDQFSEIMDCIALCRPGPLHNGGAREYADIKHGRKKAVKRHPAVDQITDLTKGQIIYQEQVLDICRIVGGFDQAGVSTARKIIAKKEGEQAFSRMKARFLRGVATIAERTDHPPMADQVGRDVFGDLITSGAYAFNAAHSAAYGLLSAWTMWLKVHEPAVFYSASLASAARNEPRTHQLLRDAGKSFEHRLWTPVQVLPPDPQRSGENWRPVRSAKLRPKIRAGISNIKGIGPKQAADIAAYREEHGLKRWEDITNIYGIGPKAVEKIRESIGSDDPSGAFRLMNDIKAVKEELRLGKLGDLPEPTHTAQDLPFEQGVSAEVVWLGTVLDRNIRDIFETNRARKGEELDRADVRDPHLNEWAQLTCEDESDQLLMVIDRWRYPECKEALFNCKLNSDLLLVEGVRPRGVSARKVKVRRLWIIEP